MNKRIVSLIAVIFLMMSVAYAGHNTNVKVSVDSETPKHVNSHSSPGSNSQSPGTGEEVQTRNIGKEREVRVMYQREEGNETGNKTMKRIQNQTKKEIRKEIKIGNKSIKVKGNLTININNQTRKIRVRMSNGKNAEIKVMPEKASERALERLRLKVCNESNNCSIELKEVGEGNQTKAAYEVRVRRKAKFLGIFKTRMEVSVDVDAETGEVIKIKKPWWAFLVTEPEEE